PGIAQPLALPGEDGTELDKRQGIVPPPPQPGKPHPAEALGWTKPRASDGLLLHRQLRLERQHLELHGPAGVEERGSKGEQSRDDGSQSETSQRALAGAHRGWTSVRREEEKVKESNGFGFSGRTGGRVSNTSRTFLS